MCCSVELVPLRGKKIQSTPTKQGIGTFYVFFAKLPTSTPVLFISKTPGTCFRASYQVHAFASSFDCFAGLLAYFGIDESDYFVFHSR